ncbi:MAG: invasion associated locus B family protein [Bosea sp. (in: a-proteobacteria)]
MNRPVFSSLQSKLLALATGAVALAVSSAALAQAAKPKPAAAASGQAQMVLLETASRWQAFSAQPNAPKLCYALSKAVSRQPANLKDVEGLLFVSTRPGQGVRNEISLVMNFDLKEDVEHQALVGDQRYAMAAKGKNLWLKNPAEEPRMLDAMRRGAELEIKATSKRGNATADKYALAGVAQAVKRAEEACK